MSERDHPTATSQAEAEAAKLAAKAKLEKTHKRVESERAKLVEDIRGAVTKDARQRVAHLLDIDPELRDSDRKLVPAYWRMFDKASLSHDDAITFDELMTVTKYTSIIRARQKIQNEYGLFLGDTAVRRERHAIANVERSRQRRGFGVPFLFVFCDESGKTQTHRLVGSVWIPATSSDVGDLQAALADWKKSRQLEREFHFKEAKGHQVSDYVDYFRHALTLAPAMSFKAMCVSKPDSGHRKVDEVIFDLHYNLVAEGVAHELTTGRTSMPRSLILFKDKDDSSDRLYLKLLRDRIEALCRPRFDNQLLLAGGGTLDSAKDHVLQIADLFTGSVNRVLNRDVGSERNFKDELAEAILGLLNLSATFDAIAGTNDKAMVMMVD